MTWHVLSVLFPGQIDLGSFKFAMYRTAVVDSYACYIGKQEETGLRVADPESTALVSFSITNIF